MALRVPAGTVALVLSGARIKPMMTGPLPVGFPLGLGECDVPSCLA